MRAHLFRARHGADPGGGARLRHEGDRRRVGEPRRRRHRARDRRPDRAREPSSRRHQRGAGRQRGAAAPGAHRGATARLPAARAGGGAAARELRRRVGVLAAEPVDRRRRRLRHHPPAALLGERPQRHRCRDRRGDARARRDGEGLSRHGHPDRRDRLALAGTPARRRRAGSRERGALRARLRGARRGQGLALQPDRGLRPAVEARAGGGRRRLLGSVRRRAQRQAHPARAGVEPARVAQLHGAVARARHGAAAGG